MNEITIELAICVVSAIVSTYAAVHGYMHYIDIVKRTNEEKRKYD